MVAPLFAYIIPFAIHFALLTKTGTGDAFMSPAFQHGLVGNNYAGLEGYKKLSFKDKFIELNRAIFDSNKTITAGHPYGSKWYSWPLLERPIWYSVDGQQYIYLLGNPFTWWRASLVSVLLALKLAWQRRQRNLANVLLLSGFLASWLPFMAITRVMFLYHYFTALIFSILILARLLDELPHKQALMMTLIVACGLSFAFFAPLSYGLPLSEQQFQQRMWLPSWR